MEGGLRVIMVFRAAVSAFLLRCRACICPRRHISGTGGNLPAFGRAMPAWLSLLHRVITVIVLMTLGLTLVIVCVAIIMAVCSCYERILLATQRWSAPAGS